MIYFHALTCGFYSTNVHGDNIPADAVEIDPEQHAALLHGQSEGKIITADENGYPVLQDPPPAAPHAPQQVTRAQGKAALIRSGLWQGVLDYVASIEDATQKAIAEVALNDTTHWQRSSPFLNAAAQDLGLNDEQLDQLFIDASKIEL